jgi:hypothetical protein
MTKLATVGLLWAAVVVQGQRLPSGQRGLCVLGCTPYVDPFRSDAGIHKYEALVDEMARTCDVIVHVGDTKPGKMPCNETLMTHAIHTLIDAGRRYSTPVLYAPGDNELNDCHRHASAPLDRQKASQIVEATVARDFLVNDLQVNSGKDLTGTFDVDQHDKSGDTNLATCFETSAPCQPYSCDFDKYVEFDDFAIATLEVIGSHWYLDVCDLAREIGERIVSTGFVSRFVSRFVLPCFATGRAF